MSAIAGVAGKILISEVLNYAFTAIDAGLERKAIIDEVLALEAAGMSPELVLSTLNEKRKAAHGDLGDELRKP
jgi:hypothetical protein